MHDQEYQKLQDEACILHLIPQGRVSKCWVPYRNYIQNLDFQAVTKILIKGVYAHLYAFLMITLKVETVCRI